MSEKIGAPTRKGVHHLVGADDKILPNGQRPASAPGAAIVASP